MVDVTSMRLVHYPCKNLPILAGECVVPAEIERIDRRTASAWAKGISVDDYLRRERFLKTRPYAAGMTIHALLDDDGSDLQAQILASCETYRVPVVVPGRRTIGFGLGVASVFVDEPLRGHGFAATLIQHVHDHFRAQGAAMMYLMSEIGPTLYARLGYVATPLSLRRFPAAPLPAGLRVEPIHADELATLIPRLPPPSSPLYIPANREQLDWHFARGQFYAGLAQGELPTEIGARSADAVAIWDVDHRPDCRRVRVLLVAAEKPSVHVEHVLCAAAAAAHAVGLPFAEVWETAALSPFLDGGIKIEADDLPMLCPLAPDVSATDFLDVQRFHWL